MPRYDFQCARCGQEFEAVLPVAQRREARCPQCGAEGARQLFRSFQAWVKGGDSHGAACASGAGG